MVLNTTKKNKRKHILDLKEKHQAMKEEGYEYIKRTHQLQVDVENLNKTTLDMKKQPRALHAEHAKLSSRHDVVNNALRALVKIPEAISTLQQQINMNLSNKNYQMSKLADMNHKNIYMENELIINCLRQDMELMLLSLVNPHQSGDCSVKERTKNVAKVST